MKIGQRTGLTTLAASAVVVGFACGPGEVSRNEPAGIRDQAVYVQERGVEGGTVLAMDFSRIEKPGHPSEFIKFFHLPPVRQDRTETCWSFAATSLLESELRRLGRAEVKLSEMFTVYWEYVEKARRFVREKGDSFLGQGSEPGSALARISQYGIVRSADYSGLEQGAAAHDHRALFREFRSYLESIRARGDWDEEKTLAGVRAILDHHLGRPPDRILVDGRSLTPREYLEKDLGLRPGDYVSFVSFSYLPFYTKGEFRVPDNWWHSADYHNLPLYEFTLAILRALRRGFTATLAVDFSEPGYSGGNGIAVIPTFDLPGSFIDQSSREFRFASRGTTDDHSVHCVGYKESARDNWFLIKDSWENAYWGPNQGYFFYREDYLRLKCLMFMVHRDAAREVLEKFGGRK